EAGSADVADPEVAREAVERETPGVAQPVADDLPGGARLRRVDPKNLAELTAEILRSVLGIANARGAVRRVRSAVAQPDVGEAAPVERELTALVVVVGLGDVEQLSRARRDGDSVVGAELDDAGVAVPIRVVDVEEVVLLVPGVERHRQEPQLTAASD